MSFLPIEIFLKLFICMIGGLRQPETALHAIGVSNVCRGSENTVGCKGDLGFPQKKQGSGLWVSGAIQ